MPGLPLIPEMLPQMDNDTPLPLLVAKRWHFPLAYVVTDEDYVYAIQDWIKGLTGAKDARQLWNDMQRKNSPFQLSDSIRQLPYVATNGKTYQLDFTDDKGLYLVAQHLRVTRARPVLDEIKKFLAASGAFVDLVRREPETVITSGAIDPDDAIDAAIATYRAQGKEDRWIDARLSGKVKRARFTAALQTAIREIITRTHYALATDEIYIGLWGRTAALLKEELKLSPRASLRDNQPTLALAYQGLAEEIAAQRLGDRVELAWEEAREIVRVVANLIGEQAGATSRFLQTDLATGKPLLSDSHQS